MRGRCVTLGVAAAVATTVAAGPGAPAAAARWHAAGGAGASTATVATLGAGQRPTAVASGSAVTVAWAQTTFLGGTLGGAGGGYRIARHPAGSSSPATVGSGCAGTVTGGAATLQCVETGVPDGSWEYTVTPVLGGFTGSEGARRAVTVDTTPPPAPSAVSVTAGGPVQGTATCGVAAGTRFVNRAGRAAVGVSVTIAAPEAGESVVLSATTSGSTPVTATVAAASTTVTATLDLTSLLDGPVTLTARTQDATGNASSTASPANVVVKDTVAGALSALSYNNVVLFADSMGGTSECGATIVATETVGPNVGKVFPSSGTFVVGAGGTFSGFTLDAVSLGAYSYTVVATDLAGNASAGTVLSGSDLL